MGRLFRQGERDKASEFFRSYILFINQLMNELYSLNCAGLLILAKLKIIVISGDNVEGAPF